MGGIEYEFRKCRNSLGINAATEFGDHRNYRVGLRADADAGCHGWSVEYPNQRYRAFGVHWVLETVKSESSAPTGLNDAQGGLPRAALADSGCRAKAVELIALLNTQVHSGFRLGMGGTSALTPARPP